MGKRSKPKWVRKLARKQVRELLELAEKNHSQHPERSKRYVELAQKTAQKYSIKLPTHYKRRICDNCGAFLVPGQNLTVRLDPDKESVSYICGECGHSQNYGYSQEKQGKKEKN